MMDILSSKGQSDINGFGCCVQVVIKVAALGDSSTVDPWSGLLYHYKMMFPSDRQADE